MHVIVKPALGVNVAHIEIHHCNKIIAKIEVSEILHRVTATANICGVEHGWNIANAFQQCEDIKPITLTP